MQTAEFAKGVVWKLWYSKHLNHMGACGQRTKYAASEHGWFQPSPDRDAQW